MSDIGDRVRELRKSEHSTQKDFARRLLVSQSYLSGIENKNETPTNKLIKLICLEFGVSEQWLISGQGDMYEPVYENDKSVLSNVSNSALLQIMKLLNTQSNVQYGHFAYSLASIADILDNFSLFGESEGLQYLSNVEEFMKELHRAIFAISQGKRADKGHYAQCKEAQDALVSLFASLENMVQ